MTRLLAIGVPLYDGSAGRIWNLVPRAELWPVLLLRSALFAIGCYSFDRLLFAPDARSAAAAEAGRLYEILIDARSMPSLGLRQHPLR